MSCGDNKYSCPARMSDARAFTDYSPRCKSNFEQLDKPMTSYDYRMHLTHNAEKMMEDKRKSALQTNLCEPCTTPSTMLPEQHVQQCDGRKCIFPTNDVHGLGVGRKYGGEQPSYHETTEVQGCNIHEMGNHMSPL